jgi:hypothetical protein
MKRLLIVVLVALLSACAGTSSNRDSTADGQPHMSVDQLGNTPVPSGTKIKTSDSVIFGVGDNWTGRAVLVLPDDASSNFSFFSDQFPRRGWTLVTAMRGKRSLLVFTRSDRTVTLEIDEGSMLGSVTATMTMSPTNNAMPAAAGARSGTNAGAVPSPVR